MKVFGDHRCLNGPRSKAPLFPMGERGRLADNQVNDRRFQFVFELGQPIVVAGAADISNLSRNWAALPKSSRLVSRRMMSEHKQVAVSLFLGNELLKPLWDDVLIREIGLAAKVSCFRIFRHGAHN
jgi:hypothetical protein